MLLQNGNLGIPNCKLMKYEEDQPKKSLGQHWLYDQDSLQAMIEAADINSEDIVLEIGPGLGTLTKLLVCLLYTSRCV